jgi:predicted nucleotidyltransferase
MMMATVAAVGIEPVTEDLLAEVAAHIVEALAPERIILFGSYANGEPTADSDIDLLIVMETTERPAVRRQAVSRLFRRRRFPLDIIVRTPAEVEEALQQTDPFIREILQKGRVLYERFGAGEVGRQGRS